MDVLIRNKHKHSKVRQTSMEGRMCTKAQGQDNEDQSSNLDEFWDGKRVSLNSKLGSCAIIVATMNIMRSKKMHENTILNEIYNIKHISLDYILGLIPIALTW